MSESHRPVDLAELVACHHAELYRYAFRLLGRSADAEDLVQQTFLQAQAKREQLRDRQCARAWLFSILRNCFQMGLRKQRREPTRSDEADLDQVAAAPEEPIVDGELLQSALDELQAEHKLILMLFYFEQCSYREIAARLQLPLGTVMSRLARAKGHLRQKLFALDPEYPVDAVAESAPRSDGSAAARGPAP